MTQRRKRSNNQELPREVLLTIAALNTHAQAINRFRRAAFGLDREDRYQIAVRLSAEYRAKRGEPRVPSKYRGTAKFA